MKRFQAFPVVLLVLISFGPLSAVQDFHDRTHWSDTFKQWRHYRIILPQDYDTSGKHYPVVYYFHGHSSRYTGEPYGDGLQVSLPEMIDYVKKHDIIAVRWDGYVEDNYGTFYGGSPYDIQQEKGGMDFGKYFLELTAHVDSAYRTVSDRQHRGVCGLSMGGFMSLYLAGRYPDIIGSASSYNPGHEFFVGPSGARVQYMLKNHVSNNGSQKVRLIRASGDYISQYHIELNEIYSRTPEVDYQYRQEEYHRHWVTGLAETLDFHLQAFADKSLNDIPRSFDHDDPFPEFSLWDWNVQVRNKKPGYVCLRDVQHGFLRVFTRAWDPDGPPVGEQEIRITTPDHYGNGKLYRIMDYSHRDGTVSYREVRSSERGSLTFTVDGSGHDLAVLNGQESRAPILLPVGNGDAPVVYPDRETHLPLRFINSNDVVVRGLSFSLGSDYPTVQIDGATVVVDSLLPGQVIDLSDRFTQRFVSTSGTFQHCRLNLHVGYMGWYGQGLPGRCPGAAHSADGAGFNVLVLDGREVTLPVFRQRGNQGGGFIYQKTIREGKGNGNGVADPGEEVTLWVRTSQGLDPLDKHTWHRTRVYSDDSRVAIKADIAQPKELEWTSVNDHTSLVLIAPDTPSGASIPLVLKNESYSYVWEPDRRFGEELLYQARQFHSDHIHRLDLYVGRNRTE